MPRLRFPTWINCVRAYAVWDRYCCGIVAYSVPASPFRAIFFQFITSAFFQVKPLPCDIRPREDCGLRDKSHGSRTALDWRFAPCEPIYPSKAV